jgi:hypothetical protein
MRLFAAVTCLALGLFWSYPFLAPGIENALHSKVKPAPRHGDPVLVLAPADFRAQSPEAVASNLTESSEDPHQ